MSVHEWIQNGAISDEIAEKRGLKELIRCKDCVKHGSVSCPMCKKYVFTTADNWFCADGERKPTQTNAKNDALDVR